MDTVRHGDLVPIEATVLDAALSPLTGKSDILMSVRRVSDDQFLDWSDMTFKTSNWTTRQAQMSEVNATLDPGDYRRELDTVDLPPANEVYAITVVQSPGTDAANMPQKKHLKVIGPYR